MQKIKFIPCIIIFALALLFGTQFPNLQKDECTYEKPVSKTQSQPVNIDNKIDIFLLKKAIDINSASASELTALPSIGPALAERIVDYRKANGDFAMPEEIMDVPGINEKIFDRIKNLICVK